MSEPRRVNFVHLSSANYAEVNRDIFGLVRRHLPGDGTDAVTDTVEERVEGAVNLGLHLRRGPGGRQVPMPIDVLLSHGLADKSYLLLRHKGRLGRPLVNGYPHVLVPGPWHVDRLLALRRHPLPQRRITLTEDRLHVVGWPRLDRLFALNDARPPHTGRPRLLWAPSHDVHRVGAAQVALSSYPAFEQHLPALREHFDVEVSLHPVNREEKTPTNELLVWADVVVTDFGTMLWEAWALDKCVIMPSWLMPPEMTTAPHLRRSAEGHVYATRLGQHATSFEHLVELACAGEPPDSAVRAFLADYLEPAHRGTSGRHIAELLPWLPLAR